MKNLTLTLLVFVACLGGYAWATCNNPIGSCPPGFELVLMGTSYWPCCDQTRSCPINGEEWARFYRSQTMYQYINDYGNPSICGSGPIRDWATEQDECCGDPIGSVGMPVM